MDGFWLYFNNGLNHFLDWDDYSHMLTLIVLVAGIAVTHRKEIFWTFLCFSLGVLSTMLLSTYEVVSVKAAWVRFLVPLLILGMALYDMFTAGKPSKNHRNGVLYFLAVFFGLVHGLSVSNHATTIDWAFGSLLEYFLGLFIAQILVLVGFFLIGFVFKNLFRFSNRDWALVVSALVIGLVAPLLVQI